ncbi:MAG: GtrA family protein, partial [Candidatus Eisenbacteria bacterium]|nr:GtrA family protein [Candidatus Eisenbacteria bacterium]
AAGGLACFLVNRRFTFPPGKGAVALQFSRFWVVFFVSMLLSELLLGVFHRGLGLDSLTGKLLSEGMLLVFNFLGLRHWVYR